VALRVHSSKVEGVYKDNLPGVVGVKVEVKKMEKYISKGNRGRGRRKRRRYIRGPLGSKMDTTTVPRQQRQKCLLVFLNLTTSCTPSVSVRSTWVYRRVRKNPQAHRNTVVALHLRSIPKGIESKE
jgi:hypothetical protein